MPLNVVNPMLRHTEIAVDCLELVRAARDDLKDQIAASQETIASTLEMLKKIDEMLKKTVLKP
jgi:hypothetical protein